MLSREISTSVLTVGQTYKHPRGGISGVINTYSKYFSPFKFVSTYNPHLNKYLNVFHFLLSLFPLVGTLMLDKQIRIVHIHGAERGSVFRKYVVLIIAKRLFRKKVIFHSHGAEFHLFYSNANKITKGLINSFMKDVDLVICLSKQWRVFFESTFKLQRIEVLENIVERAPSLNDSLHANPFELLFLGEIGDRKGLFDLLHVLKDHKVSLTGKAHLMIGGKGEVDRLLRFISEHNLQELVTFEGWVAGEKKHRLLAHSDLYILPSYNEGLPVSILEAMSYGLPIISTRVGGIPEVVVDGINGFVVEPGDQAALFSSISQFINNPALKRGMGQNSLEMVGPYYSESVVPKLGAIYEGLLCNS